MSKPIIATASLAGCFGCHMSILDIDERILHLIELVEFHKSPIDDIKKFTKMCDIGLIEGGCCNSENVENLRAFRKNCKILDLGRRMRHHGRPARHAQRHPGPGVPGGGLPQRADRGPADRGSSPTTRSCRSSWTGSIPATRSSRSTPSCRAARRSAELIWKALVALVEGKPLELAYDLVKFD